MKERSDRGTGAPGVNDRRRAHRRQTFEQHGIVGARVRPGYEVVLVDVSAGGALVECARRLLPGSLIELHLASAGGEVSVRGRVIRCAVARLRAADVWYQGAIKFDRDLCWFQDHDAIGYSVPAVETRDSVPGRADATRAAR